MADPDRDHRTDLPVDPSAASCGYAASQCGSHWNPALVLRSIPRILTGIHQINVVCISLYRTIMYAGCRLCGDLSYNRAYRETCAGLCRTIDQPCTAGWNCRLCLE